VAREEESSEIYNILFNIMCSEKAKPSWSEAHWQSLKGQDDETKTYGI